MTSNVLDVQLLQQWVGRTETAHDFIDPGKAAALAATLDRMPDAKFAVAAGAALPPLWHWVYFCPVANQSTLGSDGHPPRGGFLPPVPLPRRMWAGGRLKFGTPLPIGSEAMRASRILDVKIKSGASGSLAFVTVQHKISADGVLCITEEHDIVYRAMPQQDTPTPAGKPAPTDALWERRITPDPVLLFRYSALTFNGHRIHYDRSYVTDVEHYPGLVVHGPLIATLLVDLLQRHMPGAILTEFNFRAVGPLFDTDDFSVCGTPDVGGHSVRLWAKNSRGELAMQAQATLA